jgi:hypothetical protein
MALFAYACLNQAAEAEGQARIALLDGDLGQASPFWWLPAEKWRNVVSGCIRVMRRWKGPIPVAVIPAPEKGLKTRLPTKTILPVVILGGFLRHIIDQFLVCDRRIGPSITSGDMLRHAPVQKDWRGDWHSVDCVVATDNFTPEYMGEIYRAVLTASIDLIPYDWQELLWEVWAWLFHNRVLIEGLDSPPKPVQGWEKSIRLAASAGLLDFETGYFVTHVCYSCNKAGRPPGSCDTCKSAKKQYISALEYQARHYAEAPTDFYLYKVEDRSLTSIERRTILVQWDTWLSKATHVSSPPLGRGVMMGDPTSWPGLPLATLYAWEQSVPRANYNDIATTGDDAYFQAPSDEHEHFKNVMQAGGAEFSMQKYFSHRCLALYREEVLRNGVREPYFSLAPLVGPPGGSKGESNWSTAPDSAIALAKARHCSEIPPALFRVSRFYPDWVSAQKLGIPTQLPPRWGGLNYPYGKWKSNKYHRLWGSYVARLSRLDLTLKGPGLHLVSTPKVSNDTPMDIFLTASDLQKERELDDRGTVKSPDGLILDGVMGPKPDTHWDQYREVVRSANINAGLDTPFRTDFKAYGQWLESTIKTSEKTGATTGVHLSELRQHLSTPSDLNRLLSGFRPPNGKVPSVFTLGNLFYKKIRRVPLKAIPKDDLALIQLKEDLLSPLVDLSRGPMAFKSSVLPKVHRQGEPFELPNNP